MIETTVEPGTRVSTRAMMRPASALAIAACTAAAATGVLFAVPPTAREPVGIAIAAAVAFAGAVLAFARAVRSGPQELTLWLLVGAALACVGIAESMQFQGRVSAGALPQISSADVVFGLAIACMIGIAAVLIRDSVRRDPSRARQLTWDVPGVVFTYAMPAAAFAFPWMIQSASGSARQLTFNFAFFSLYLVMAVAIQLVVYAEGRLTGLRLTVTVGLLALLCSEIVTAVSFVLFAWIVLWTFGLASLGTAALVRPDPRTEDVPTWQVHVLPYALTLILGLPLVLISVVLTSGLQRLALIAGFVFVALAVGRLSLRLLRRVRELSDVLADRNAELVQRVAELEVAHDELRHLARAKDDFASMVIHELRSPATVVTGLSATLRDRRGGLADQDIEDLLDRIYTAGATLQRLVEDLHGIIGDDVGTFRLSFARIDLDAVIGKVAAGFSYLAPGNRLGLLVHPGSTGLQLWADAARLEQVLRNLIENASRYAPPGSPIHIETRPAGRVVEISVEDEGPGVPAHMAERIFDPFVSGQDSIGSGLGLAISRKIVRDHGGTLTLGSAVPEGARFLIRLPILERDGTPERRDARAEHSAPSTLIGHNR